MLIGHSPTGQILMTVNDPVPEGMAQSMEGLGYLVFDHQGAFSASSISSSYIHDGEIIARPNCPAGVVVNQRSITLSDLPSGSEVVVEIEGEAVPVQSSIIELDEAGPLTIRITPPWPYMEACHEVTLE